MLKHLKGNIVQDSGIDNDFLNRTPMHRGRAQELTNRLQETKNFCVAKDTISHTKSQTTEWKTIFADFTSDRGHYLDYNYRDLKSICKNLTKSNKMTLII